MWSKWASASSSVQQLGASNCFLNHIQICTSFVFWVRLIVGNKTCPYAIPGPWHSFFKAPNPSLHLGGGFIWQSTAVDWKFESRWYRINSLSTMFCCCFVVNHFSYYCLSQDAFGAEVVKVLFHESLGIQYSSSGYNHVFVDDFQNQIWSQICGQLSIFIFTYTYDYICISYTDRSNV